MSSFKKSRIISLDIGNVLLDHGSRDSRADPRTIPSLPPVAGAREGVQMLLAAFGRENIFVVSRCSEEAEAPLAAWLVSAGFAGGGENQIDPRNVRFCRERAGKANILGGIGAIAHVDDRAEVLIATAGLATLRLRVLFAPSRGELSDLYLSSLPGLLIEPDWSCLASTLIREISRM